MTSSLASLSIDTSSERRCETCKATFETLPSQFTSIDFTRRLKAADIRISMDGRGRALDNVFVERLWRSVKYEEVYLKDYSTPREAIQGLEAYFAFYNGQRLHQSLNYQTPAAVYFG